MRCSRLIVLEVPLVWLLAVGCQERPVPAGAPAEFREHTEFRDFVSMGRMSEHDYVLVFDSNKDSSPDTWEYWNFTNQVPLQRVLADKDFNGRVDTWMFFDPSEPLYMLWDTNGDGVADKRLYKDGMREAITNSVSGK